MRTSPSRGLRTGVISGCLLLLGSGAVASVGSDKAEPGTSELEFSISVDLGFCNWLLSAAREDCEEDRDCDQADAPCPQPCLQEQSTPTLGQAAACLAEVRNALELASPRSQGYAHSRPDPPSAFCDPGVRACLGARCDDPRTKFSDVDVHECQRKVFRDRRNYLTSTLAGEAREREKTIAGLKADLEGETDPSGANEASISAKRAKMDEAQVARNFIGRTIALPDCDSLFVDHRCYDAWFANFSAGGEYNSVNEILGEKLLPRTGVLIYRNYSSYERWRRLHFFGEFRLAGAGESSSINDVPGLGDEESAIVAAAEAGDDPAEPEPEPEPEIEKALDARGAIFWPLVKIGAKVRQERKLQELIGPIVELGVRKVDKADEVDKRYYTGLRMSFNPEWYLDVLYGKTESVRGRRIEVRGQMPVIPVKTGNHVYIGAVANFSASNEDAGETPQKDTVQVYLTWNVDFKSIFGK